MKICKKCGKKRRTSSFYWANEKLGYRRRDCKWCSLKRVSTWWKKTTPEQRKKHYKASVATDAFRIERNVRWLASYLKEHPCNKCGATNILALEFHHREPKDKKYRVSELVSTGKSLERIFKEVDKCDVLCSNCHRIETAYQLNYRILKYVESVVGVSGNIPPS